MLSTPTPTAGGKPFFGRVESVRGLGALAVAGFHFSLCLVHGAELIPHAAAADAGWVEAAVSRVARVLLTGQPAVVAFFVISGLVLRVSLENGPRPAGTASAKFVLARLFRFLPIAAVGVVVTTAMLALGVPPWPGTPMPDTRLFLANLFLLDTTLLSQLWTMQVELLAAPFILAAYFAERRWGAWVAPAAALAATGLSFSPHWALWKPLSVNLFAFLVGMALPTAGRTFAAGLSRRTAGLAAAGAAVAVLAAGPCFGVYSRFAAIVEVYAVGVGLSVAAYRPDVRVLKWLDARPLRLLGSSSGSYYVLHMATAPLLVALASAVVPAASAWRGVIGAALVAAWLVVIAPPMVVVYRAVEVPGIAAGRRLARSLGLDRRPPVGAVAPPTAVPVHRAAA